MDGKATDMNLNRGFLDSHEGTGTVDPKEMNKKSVENFNKQQSKEKMLVERRESIISACYECIRDGASTDFPRAI